MVVLGLGILVRVAVAACGQVTGEIDLKGGGGEDDSSKCNECYITPFSSNIPLIVYLEPQTPICHTIICYSKCYYCMAFTSILIFLVFRKQIL